MTTVPKIGQTVRVRLFTDKIITGEVVHVWEHAEGWCVRVVSGATVYSVTLAQVVSGNL
jgi:hypothetical protein